MRLRLKSLDATKKHKKLKTESQKLFVPFVLFCGRNNF